MNSFKLIDIISTDLIKLTMFAVIKNTEDTFSIAIYVEVENNIESQNFDVPAFQEKHAYLETMKPIGIVNWISK